MSLRRIALVVLAVVIATALGACALLPFGGDDAAAPPPPPPPPATEAADTTATGETATTDAAAETPIADATSGDDAVEEPPAMEVAAAEEEEEAGPVKAQALSGAEAKVFADCAYLINVDKPANYRIEHIDDAVNVPLGELADASAGWKKDGAVMVTGRKTGLARSGAAYLSRQGFKNVAYLEGGHNAWSGWYEGVAEREPVTRAKIYFIYRSRSLPTDEADAAAAELRHTSVALQIAEDYRAIGDRFSEDVDIELVDASAGSASLRRAVYLLELFDVPKAEIAEGVYDWSIPFWILEDKNGRITFGWSPPDERGTIARVYGWMVQESMRDTVHEARRDHPVGGATFIWLDQAPWVRPDP